MRSGHGHKPENPGGGVLQVSLRGNSAVLYVATAVTAFNTVLFTFHQLSAQWIPRNIGWRA